MKTNGRVLTPQKGWKYASLSANPLDDFRIGGSDESVNPLANLSENDGEVAFFLRFVGQYRVPTKEENWELARRIRLHDDARAREAFILANLRLVVREAMTFQGVGLDFIDVILEGCIGLIKTADKFDERRQVGLPAYGSYWIKQTILRALADQGSAIRLPLHVGDSARSVSKKMERLHSKLGRVPTLEEIADEVGLPPERVSFLLEKRKMRIPESLDAPLPTNDGAGSEFSLKDMIVDTDSPDPAEETDRHSLPARITQVLARLSEREREVLKYRFGFYGNTWTLEEVGKKFRLTRERIRQIEAKALIRLRAQRFTGFLRGYSVSCSYATERKNPSGGA